MKSCGVLFLALTAAMTARADDGLQELLACMHANVPRTAHSQQIEVTSTDRSGSTRVLTGKLYARAEDTPAGPRLRTLLKIDTPPDLAGAAYLLRQSENYLQDGMYVYLPSVRRVRRVSGTFADGALLGTNFSYNDFRQVLTAFVDASARLEAPTEVEGRAAQVLAMVPPPAGKSVYSLVRVWVDRKSCVPLKVEFRKGAKGQTLVKELSVAPAALQHSGKRWYASVVQMRDLEDGTSSVLRLAGTQLGVEIPASYFDPAAFHLGK